MGGVLNHPRSTVSLGICQACDFAKPSFSSLTVRKPELRIKRDRPHVIHQAWCSIESSQVFATINAKGGWSIVGFTWLYLKYILQRKLHRQSGTCVGSSLEAVLFVLRDTRVPEHRILVGLVCLLTCKPLHLRRSGAKNPNIDMSLPPLGLVSLQLPNHLRCYRVAKHMLK